MSGRIIYSPKTPTPCERNLCEGKPPADVLTPGTIWACDDCDKQWVVVAGAQYNEHYQAWRVLNKQNRTGMDL